MIRLNHVSKIYGDGSKKAVDDLSWDIEDGKITGFIGPNGAGKTTTLKMITGILAPSEGTIEINGKDIQKDPLEAKRQFGFVPDDPDAFLRVRGIEYLNLVFQEMMRASFWILIIRARFTNQTRLHA